MTLRLATLAATLMISTTVIAQDIEPTATANMIDAEGARIGTVTFTETASGQTIVMVEVANLPAGTLGFHVHEVGVCDIEDGFESAGGHYAGDREHGVRVEGGPHPGDFPNVHVGEDGVLKVEFFSPFLTINEGDYPLMDADGSSVIIHSGPDDYQSQPAGNAGDRIACGVVEQPS